MIFILRKQVYCRHCRDTFTSLKKHVENWKFHFGIILMIAFQIPAKSRHWLILFVQRHSQDKKSYFSHFFHCIPPRTFAKLRFYIDNLVQRLIKDLLRSYKES
jgi:hypothetical protein